MEQRAIGGVRWTFLTYALTRGITFATTLVLARLLAPRDFGIMALALLMTTAFGLVSELGLASTLVLRQDLDRRAQGTFLSLMTGTGAVVAVGVAAVSPLAGSLLGEPRVTPVLSVLACSLVLSGANGFHETLLVRELRFRRRFLAQAVQSLTYAAVALTLAVAGVGVWSLVLGFLAGTLAYGVVLVCLVPDRVRPSWEGRTAAEALRTGKGFLAQGGLAFVRQNADYLIVGRTLGAAPLGIYSMAFRISELPSWAIADPTAKVTFPGLARMRERGEAVESSFLSTLRLVALVACPFGVVISASADPFVRTVFGEEWLSMIPALYVLGLWGALRPVQVTAGWFLNSIGRPGALARVSVITLLLLLPSLVLAARAGGITAVAWVMVGEVLVSTLLIARAIQRLGGIPALSQWAAVRPICLAAPLSWLAAWTAAAATAGAPAPAALGAAGAAGLITFLVLVAISAPGLLPSAVADMSRVVGRTRQPAQPLP